MNVSAVRYLAAAESVLFILTIVVYLLWDAKVFHGVNMEHSGTIDTLKDKGVTISLETVVDGLTNPVAMAYPADGSKRIFIIEQVGRIYLLAGKEKTLFLDISDEVVDLDPEYDERGLLGMAFHPKFTENSKFYLYYNAPPETQGWNSVSILAEYKIENDIPSRIRTLLKIQQPQMNHNGGHITFGPDGFLYIPLGDGGGQNDRDRGHDPEIGNGQSLETMLGKILRIDVDTRSEDKEYGIPEDNPFVNGGGLPEIFAYGLRNPYHISFDRGTGRLFAADVGQSRWEEVDIIVKGGNYGWNIREGYHCFDVNDNRAEKDDCPDHGARGEKLIDPIMEYPNASNRRGGIGTAVIGGYVYRGESIPHLQGAYIFGDFSGKSGSPKGKIFIGTEGEDGKWKRKEAAIHGRDELGEYILAFGEDANGEVYVMTSKTEGPSDDTGKVQKIVSFDL